MNAYLLQLGHCPDLSHAEVLSVADRLGDVLHVQRRLDSVLFAEGADPERIQELCGELGGTIRLCEIKPFGEADRFDFMPDPSPEQLFDALLSTKIGDELIARNPRPLFGFSILDESHWGGRVKKIIGLLHETASLFKDHLKERGHASRFVRPNPEGKSACLGGAQVEKNALLQKGGEIVFHLHPETGLTLGMTQWLQPFEAYSKRDYGRPQRDARQGMLPPKLARMMVNIARTDSTSTLLDPFCGSGSILMEAGLLGLQTTGVDINRKAVQSSLGNWDWLKGQGGEPTGGLRAIYGDARNLRTLFEPLYFEACATEPYLGPPQRSPLDGKRFDRLTDELIPLYLRALGEIRTVMKPGARVVFIVPRFRMSSGGPCKTLPLLHTIKLQGYTILDPLAGFTPIQKKAALLYSRPSQIVQREIYVLQA